VDYPSDPVVGLVGGKFNDGDPVGGIPASLDRAAEMNAVYDEMITTIKQGGLVPDETDKTQLSIAIKNLVTSTVASHALPPRHISNLTLANNALDPAYDIDISPGAARDEFDGYNMVLTTTLTKQLNAIWAPGTNAGGLFVGAVAADTSYHIFLIYNIVDGYVDVGFDTSANAANRPDSGNLKYRRIGTILTDANASIQQFSQFGNIFTLKNGKFDYVAAAVPLTFTLRVPTGITTLARIAVTGYPDAAAGVTSVFYISETSTTGVGPPVRVAAGDNGTYYYVSQNTFDIVADINGLIKATASLGGFTRVEVQTIGWVDYR